MIDTHSKYVNMHKNEMVFFYIYQGTRLSMMKRFYKRVFIHYIIPRVSGVVITYNICK